MSALLNKPVALQAEDIIDRVLLALDSDGPPAFPSDIKKLLNFEISDKDLALILSELNISGYASLDNARQGQVILPHTKLYAITYKGKLFLSKGGYKGEKNRTLIQKTWDVAKITVTVIYSVLVLLVAAWGLYVSQDDKNKDRKIQNLNTQIAAQQKEIERLKSDFKNKSIK